MRAEVTGMTYSDGTPAVTMSYDAAGRPLEIRLSGLTRGGVRRSLASGPLILRRFQ
jgi:YD repeat-containing protein